MFNTHLLSPEEKKKYSPLEQARIYQARDANPWFDASFDELINLYSRFGWVFASAKAFYMVREVDINAPIEDIVNPIKSFSQKERNAFFCEQVCGDVVYALENLPVELRGVNFVCGLRAGKLIRYSVEKIKRINREYNNAK